ncbi:hypothetical protein DIPPA_22198 [Diplonema papillatum]|nr:hypothetical protein DIPPA_22198 [Diplonema papillatum]
MAGFARLSVATWNVSTHGMMQALQDSELVRLLQTTDVLGLQEVADVKQAETFAGAIGMAVAATGTADFGLVNALLVRQTGKFTVEPEQPWALHPRASATHDTRAAAVLRLKIRREDEPSVCRHVLIVCTHLDHISEDVRLTQVRQVVKRVDGVIDRCEAEYSKTVYSDLKSDEKQLLLDRALAKGALSKEGHEKATQALKHQATVAPATEENKEPIEGVILLGDFNSLSLGDYKTDEELAALKTRRKKAGVEQPYFSVVRELEHENMVDTRSLARAVTGPLATSHYGVRVDYVFVSYPLLSVLQAAPSYETIAVPDDISDHNPVITTLEIFTDSRSNKPQDVGTIFCR